MNTPVLATRKSTAPLWAQLPPFPAIAAKLIVLVTAPKVCFREVADLVRTDGAFTARVLRLANSPLLGGREVSSVLQALSVLGSDRLNALVMTLAVHQMMSREAGSELQRRCWRHCLAAACIAETIAPRFDVVPDVAYTAGLLHDIGCLALAGARGREYEQLLRSVHTVDEQLAAESSHFGVDHGQLGAQLVAHWAIPKTFQPLMVDHHTAEPSSNPLVSLVRIADPVANHVGFSIIDVHSPPEWPEWLAPDMENGHLPRSIAERINRIECSLT